MISIMNSNAMGVVELSCLAKDLPEIKAKYSDRNYTTGSSCLVVDTRDIYFWDNESKKWLGTNGTVL